MELGIKGKTALVFGASRGIGKGIASALASEGVNLLLVARSENKLQMLAEELSDKYSIETSCVALDISAVGAVEKLLSAVAELPVNIDILINISGGPRVAAAMHAEGQHYQAQFNPMVAFFIDISRKLAKTMMKNNWGRIVTVASSGVTQPIKDLAISNSLRAALVSWNKTLATELAGHGVTVNTLIPGRIHTERVDEIDQKRAEAQNIDISSVVERSHAGIPAGRYGTVEEFASTAIFLSSQPAGYITGSCIRVDGGLIASIF